MNVLITGASGFLGCALLSRIALDPAYDKIYLLIRGNERKPAAARVKDLVKKVFPPAQQSQVLAKLHAIQGDLIESHLGLKAKDRWEILENVHQIVHVGASTDFGAPLAESRLYNVEGTRKVLELAEACKRQGVLERLDYISTAFVSGNKSGRVNEKDLHRSQTFANNYERSKYEAEALIRDAMLWLPIAVHRPSIVVGDSRNGYTPHFKVLYWPLKILSKDLLPFIPANRGARLDVVPVDFVADSIAALMKDATAPGKTFHLTAGIGHEVTLGQVSKDAVVHAGIKQRPMVPVWAFNVLRKTPLRKIFSEDMWQTVELANPYASYVRGTGVRYDARETHARLKQLGIEPPVWKDYSANVMRFCVDSHWGKRLSAPDYKYYERAQA